MSAGLLVLVPLRVEELALGRPAGAKVLRTGMGAGRARIAAARALGDDACAVAVAGVCAGIAPEARPGDAILADRMIGPAGDLVEVPGSALLDAALRRRGVRVHVGPLLSAGRLVGPDERRRLAGRALAVDMESAWLAAGAGGRPLAVVRVVADAAERRLADPRLALAGIRALDTLRRVGPALAEWGAAVGPRTVLLAGPRSFCAGVERAIDIVERALAQRGVPVYVRKQIVHNEHVVADLERRGAVFVEELDEVPDGSTVVFSAHGVSPAVRRRAAAQRFDVIDATCPLVSKVHAEARRFASEGRTIFLIGHEGHEEVEGTLGEAPEAIRLVEDIRAAELIEVPEPERVSYLTQTTLAVDETDEIVAVLRERFPELRGPASDDICYATANRQHSVRAARARPTWCSSPARGAPRTPSGWSRSPAARAHGRTSSTTRPRSTSPGSPARARSRSPPAPPRPNGSSRASSKRSAPWAPSTSRSGRSGSSRANFRLPKEVVHR